VVHISRGSRLTVGLTSRGSGVAADG